MELPSPQLLAVTDQLLAGGATPRRSRRHCCDVRRGGARHAHARSCGSLTHWPARRWSRYCAGPFSTPGSPHPFCSTWSPTRRGGFAGHADLAWPAQRVLVEFDGDLHRDRDVFVNDLRRQNRLVAAGWTVLRFSSADLLGRPGEVVAEVRAALRRR